MLALVIQPHADVYLSQVDGLRPLQDLVEGYIEAVDLPQGAHGYINEEGKLRGMPVNPLATLLYGQWPADCINGPLVVVGSAPNGEDDNVPELYARLAAMTGNRPALLAHVCDILRWGVQ
jgi:hypothetical protein